jgi:hypothetical protein
MAGVGEGRDGDEGLKSRVMIGAAEGVALQRDARHGREPAEGPFRSVQFSAQLVRCGMVCYGIGRFSAGGFSERGPVSSTPQPRATFSICGAAGAGGTCGSACVLVGTRR